MNMRDIPWLAVLAVTLLVGNPAFAQKSGKAAAPLNEQRVALVIGNSAYKDSPLANPVNDAADMAQALQNAGFKVILKRNASTRDMRQAIREFANELRRAQVGLFYFAGHGVQVKGANYLVPVGADIQSEADAEDLSVDANFVLRTMEDAQTKVSIVILDACRNNPFARSFRSTSRGLAQMTAATGSIVAFATAPGSVAADGTARNGIYTKHLLESLRQPDTDILKVFQRTRAAVVKETGGKQTPWESTSLTGDFYFRPGVQVASVKPSSTPVESGVSPLAIELAFWNTINSSTNAVDFEDYLNRFPDGQFAGLAKNRLDALRAPPVQTTLVPPTTSVPQVPASIGYDRHTPSTATADAGIELKIAGRISDNFRAAHINVTSYSRMVLLTGEAPDAASKRQVVLMARSIEYVRGVYDEVTITGNSSLSARDNDSNLTSKVKARFVDQQNFNPIHVKVVTESSTVYLLGLVTREEADDATWIARTTGGVQKVVKLFEYLN